MPNRLLLDPLLTLRRLSNLRLLTFLPQVKHIFNPLQSLISAIKRLSFAYENVFADFFMAFYTVKVELSLAESAIDACRALFVALE